MDRETASSLVRDSLADPGLLAQVAHEHPDLRPAVAVHPAAYEGLLTWLRSLGDPAVDAALASRDGAGSPTTGQGGGAPLGTPARTRGNSTILRAVVGGIVVLALAGGAVAVLQRGDESAPAAPDPTASSSQDSEPEPSAPTPQETSNEEPEPAQEPASAEEHHDPGVTLSSYASEPAVTWAVEPGDLVEGAGNFVDLHFPGGPHDGARGLSVADVVVVGVGSENQRAVVALDPATRTVRWTREYEENEGWAWGCGAEPLRPTLYCVPGTDYPADSVPLEVIDAASGALRATIDLPAYPARIRTTSGGNAMVLLLGVYDDTDPDYPDEQRLPGHVMEISPDGTVLWTYDFDYRSWYGPESGNVVRVDGEVVSLLVEPDWFLLDRRGGAIQAAGVARAAQLPDQRRVELHGKFYSTIGDVVLVDTTGERSTLATEASIYWDGVTNARSDRPLLIASGDRVIGWDPETGIEAWSTELGDDVWEVALATDRIAVISTERGAAMLDARTGALLTWIEDDVRSFLSDGERLVAIGPDRLDAYDIDSWETVWSFDIPEELAEEWPNYVEMQGRIVLHTHGSLTFLEPTDS